MSFRLLITLLFVLFAATAADARTLTDKFNRIVTVSDDGSTYTITDPIDGFSAAVQPLVVGDDNGALNTINSMQPSYIPLVPVLPTTTITKTAFLHRFTQAELVAISAASHTNDTVNIWLITAQSYDKIDLTDPVTTQGLDALVAAGCLTSDRETVILTP